MKKELNELKEYIKGKNGKICWNSNFIQKYITYINEQYKNMNLTSKGEYIYYLYHNESLPDSLCKCGKKKKFSSFKNPYREYCSTKCSNKYLMTEGRKNKYSIKSKEKYNSFTEEKKQEMIAKQKRTFKENWTEERSIRYSNIMKEKYKDEDYRLNNKLRYSLYSIEKQNDIINKVRSTNERLGNWITKENVKDYKDYSKLVWRYTNQNDLTVLENIEKRGIKKNEYHLDHKYSIFQGYKDNVSAEVIGNICNLEMLLSSKNTSKGNKCSISKEELLSSFDKLIGD